jgi:hypothetical protein
VLKEERELVAPMRWTLFLILIVSTAIAGAQAPAPETPMSSTSASNALPDAPGAVKTQQQDVVAVAEASFKASGGGAHPCGLFTAMKVIYLDPVRVNRIPKPCSELIYPYQRFLTTNISIPMTWQQKGYLALHDLTDPANIGTIAGISAITIGVDSHSAYGPGWKGFGKIVGVSLSQDATGQFFGVFAIPALAHQDPRYYRMPRASVPRRIFHAISRTAVARNDDGHSMPNYGTLFSYPINAAISNLYVPGIHSDGPSTVARAVTGLATDPANSLLTEFLPDVASRIHVRVIFVQRILNNVSAAESLQ